MVVEVVAGQIGERRRGDRDAIEAKLRQTVARCLDRDMIDAAFASSARSRWRPTGSGVVSAPGAPPGRRYEAERAEARRRVAERGPDLAREMGDRGLAVGAGDGGDRARLAPVEPGGEEGEAALRIGVGDDRDAAASVRIEREGGGIIGQDRHRALRDRFAGKGAPVTQRAAQRGKQKTRLHLARIGGKADDLRIGERRSPMAAGLVSSVSFNLFALQALDR